ncbi:MAG TPA: alpha/beta hydrolase fold domain-containing protein [Opitutus sp.]|nr:alpha/beta hydrolase fold domain-containing protein [Opitutus sp.]
MPRRLLAFLLFACGGAAVLPLPGSAAGAATTSPATPVRLMAVGDSITEGADFFTSYRFPLWEKLFGAGYVVEFVGTRTRPTRIGPLAHEGYSGKNTEYLAAEVPAHFAAQPADIVLLHSGHNHTVEEQPVPGIVAATEKLIAAFRAANPRVTVLLAQVIPAGKLPKYAYLPALNAALAELAARLDRADQRVVLVDQASGFDWETDTVADKVHPNARGAEKMAQRWFDALQRVLPPPTQRFAPRRITYETIGDTALQLHVFDPASPASATGPRPAVVFFFGGGWTHGTPLQFYPECAHFAANGFVAISADYRIASTHGTTPFESAADARAALRWIRTHAAELGVDPARIYAAGASAGGHLALTAALAADEPRPGNAPAVSARPDALLLWYPILDTSADGYGHERFGPRFAELSPLHLLRARKQPLPPTLILVGGADPAVPATTVHTFQTLARESGARCEVTVFPGQGHPLYSYRAGGGPLRDETLAIADRFLASLTSDAPAH